MVSTAMAIAQNHPESRAEKTLFVDVSELSQRDANTGVQRVTRSILKQLLEKPPAGYVVEPVYARRNGPAIAMPRNSRKTSSSSTGPTRKSVLSMSSAATSS